MRGNVVTVQRTSEVKALADAHVQVGIGSSVHDSKGPQSMRTSQRSFSQAKTAPPGLPPPHLSLPSLQALSMGEPNVTVRKLTRAKIVLMIFIVFV